MPAPRGKLTALPEIGAYVLAHAAGIAWGIVANPLIFRSLVQNYREHLQMIAIAISVVVALVVLVISPGLRKLFAGATAAPPPPAALPVPPPKFTDGPELAAYVLAHAA